MDQPVESFALQQDCQSAQAGNLSVMGLRPTET